MLNKSAVPTIFNFQNHLPPKIKERQILQQEVSTYIYIQNKYLYIFILFHCD